MAEKTIKVTNLLCRNDTADNWRLKNPVLKKGEWGLETDTFMMKFGDGSTTWNSLEYAGQPESITNEEITDLFQQVMA